MIKKFLWLVLGTLLSFNSSALVHSQSLYIVADSIMMVDSTLIPYVTFNETAAYSSQNPLIQLVQGDTLDLWVFNTDSISHDFVIQGLSSFVSVPANDSAFLQTVFATEGCYIYHDPSNYPANTYLGLAGMIVVRDHTFSSFFWNIKEHQADWNELLFDGVAVNWGQYAPNYFTINGRSNPQINGDTLARVTGSVGDSLFLYMVNTGQSLHAIHLHGYHATIMYSSRSPHHQYREKDTFPIYPMESLVICIVPDKEGEYPVHDHNLVAVTANNMYPNGMFSTILIHP